MARQLGGKIHVSPQDIPGAGRFGVLEDFTGAMLAVMRAVPPRADPGQAGGRVSGGLPTPQRTTLNSLSREGR
jgi:hypothetical protein